MKALVKSKAEVGLWLEDVPEPEISDNDVLIRVLKTGICGTDVHIYKWDAWARDNIKIPTIIGHEFVGEIVELGANVNEYNDFKVGDIVSGEGHLVCGRCRNCMAGRRYRCANTIGVGVQTDGSYAEYIAMPMQNIWRHEKGVNLEVASFFDPFGNAVHSALAFPMVGEDVLITGAGPIGIMAIAVARHIGARHIVITDVNPYRLELAEKFDVTRTVDVTKENLKDIQKELGMTEGFDVGLEMSGNPSAFKDMIANMAHGGSIAMLGIPPEEIAINWNKVVFNMLTIKGIYGRKIFETWYHMSVLLQSGVNIEPVITHRFPYQEFEKGFEAMMNGNCGKVILEWGEV
ncbi:MAG: L-threonine 3-dehydrogenase [Acidobacteriota bacterium]|jgi:threonine 3-dehydrogenase|nr:L-threonine 3-dehydrogenase [Acidobacteriota bacterium]